MYTLLLEKADLYTKILDIACSEHVNYSLLRKYGARRKTLYAHRALKKYIKQNPDNIQFLTPEHLTKQ